MNKGLLVSYIITFSLFLSFSANAQRKKGEKAKTITTTSLDEQTDRLMADRVDLKKEILSDRLAPIDYSSLADLLKEEDLEFPADELYASDWDNRWVNPFRGKAIKVPDSFNINCSSFSYPLDQKIRITSQFGPRRRRMHNGIDLKLHVGDTVRAAFSGKIRIKSFERRGYGNYIVIRHPNGLETVYAHLSKFLVNENEIVRAGEPIGLGGNTGRSTGPHLHFEMRFLGTALNPNHLVDFSNGVPHKDNYLYTKSNHKSNSYTSTSSRIAYHRVKKGETLGSIALKYRTSINELCRINGIKRNSVLRIGQSLRCGTVAVQPAEQKQAQSKNSTESTADNSNKSSSTNSANIKESKESKTLYHKVKPNETLYGIARKYGTTVDAICRMNKIQSTSTLRLGQKIAYKKVHVSAPTQETAKREDKQASTTQTGTTNKTDRSKLHHVQRGETLYSIARKHNISTNELCRINGITQQTVIKAGQHLRTQQVRNNSEISHTTE